MSWEAGIIGALGFYIAFYLLICLVSWVEEKRGIKSPPDVPHDTFGV